MKNLKTYKNEQMQNPAFKAAYEEGITENNIIKAIIDARTSLNLTQSELSRLTGVAQTEISRIENGTRNPSIKLLKRLACGMNMDLEIRFVPR